MKEAFLNIKDHEELAAYFNLSYKQLSKIIYKYSHSCKYTAFEIPKKSGGTRKIKSPCKRLKEIQHVLKDVLYEIYPVRPSAFGFIKGRSIVGNSQKHLDKKYVFNVDLKDFFGSIHFGRIRRLFKSDPFNFNDSVSAILAQICCVDNSLPQGAPTSPILSNMIAWKLDAQLQRLAKQTNSTYTRYADDITFSFSCKKRVLPSDIVGFNEDFAIPGHKLAQIIKDNGFEVNLKKVRLSGIGQRMEVTGLTVNEFSNVSRRYVRQIGSILYSWRKYGYQATSEVLNSKFYSKHRASDSKVSLLYFLKGKLSFLLSVRGASDPIFNKLAVQFNDLADKTFPGNELKFKIFEVTEPEANVIDSLWIIETCYDHPVNGLVTEQGTGFSLKDVGIVTCAHVVSVNSEIFENIEIFKFDNPTVKYNLKVNHIDCHRDIAICSITNPPFNQSVLKSIEISGVVLAHQFPVKLFGFPAYKIGQSYYVSDCKVATIYNQSAVAKFEIDHLIRAGNSGGPVVDVDGKLVGIALEGASQDEGNNAVLCLSELIVWATSLLPPADSAQDTYVPAC